MSGRLLVVEGLDGSGKATQTALLCRALEEMGNKVRRVSFPDYEQPSSALQLHSAHFIRHGRSGLP